MKHSLLFAFAFVIDAGAQQVIQPPTQSPVSAWLLERRTDVQPGDLMANDAQLEQIATTTSDASGALSDRLADSPYRWGPFVFHPGLGYSLLYGNSIQSQPGHPSDSLVQTISPAALLAIGSRWSLVYAPSWTVYSSSAFKNTLDQNLSLAGRNTYGDLSVGISQTFSYSDDPQIETAAQTTQRNYTTGVNAAYPIGPKVSLNASITQAIQLTSGLTDSYTWTNSDGFRYKFSSRLDWGFDLQGSYSEVNPGADLANFSGTVVIDWHPADKLFFNLAEGYEHQIFVGQSGSQNSPTSRGSIAYALFEHTQLTVSLSSMLAGSDFANTATKTTTWTVALSQRLLERFTLSASYGQGRTAYTTSGDNQETGRNDSVSTYNLSLGTKILRRTGVSLTLQGTRDASALPGYGFNSRQIGISLDYHY